MPWKNGGGITHEVAVSPPAAGLADFDWRISMAEVASDGPFSRFEGVDRTLCLMRGAGMILTLPEERRQLTAGDPMIRFPGEAEVMARLSDGPILDLNIMTRRARLRHRVLALDVTGEIRPDLPAILAVICRRGEVSVSGRTLGARDCAFPGEAGLQIAGEGAVFIVQCQPAPFVET